MSLFFAKKDPAPVRVSEASLVEDGFRQIAGGGVAIGGRELSGTKLQLAQSMCVKLYRSNPVANRTIKIYRSFLAGEGFALDATNPEVSAALQEFWTSPRSDMNRQARGYAGDWLIFGEGIHPVAADELGNVTFGFIDPMAVSEILRDPRNMALLSKIKITTGAMLPQTFNIVRPSETLDQSAGLLEGDVFAWLHDRVAASSRGTPLLLPALDWLGAYDQILWEMLERQKAIRAFFWDVEVDGGQTEVDEAKRQIGTAPPKTGSLRIHSSNMRVKAEAPQLGAYEDVRSATFHLRHLANGTGLSPHWLSEPEDANRSTAEQMDIPVFRNLVEVQAQWRMHMEELAAYVVDRKVSAGVLDAVVVKHDSRGRPTNERVPARNTVKVITPDIADNNIADAADSLGKIAAAAIQLDLLDEVLPPSVVRVIVNELLPSLGVPADEIPDIDDDAEPDAQERKQLIEALQGIGRL